MRELEEALKAEGGSRVAWLEKAWTACPHPAIADLIFEADPKDFALQGATLEQTEASIRRIAGSSDPRASAAQAALLAALPYTSDSSRPVWTALFDSLRDPRFAAVDPDRFEVRTPMKRWLTARLAEARERLVGTVPEAPDAALLAALRDAIHPPPPDDEAGLLARIYAAPEDDHPRAVYADWLSERGDPRGEFITLQLAGETKRAQKLLKGNELAWAGPIADALAKKGLVYERGFVARAQTKFKNPKVVTDLGDAPEWATLVEILGVHSAYEVGASHHTDHVGPAFRGLRILRGIGEGGVLKLAAGGPWRIEHLEIDLDTPETVDAMPRLSTLPELRSLRLTRVRRNPGWLWSCPLVATLRELTLDAVDPRILPAAERTGIQRLVFRTHRGSIEYTREGSGPFTCTAVAGDMEEDLAALAGRPTVPRSHDEPYGIDVSPDGTLVAVAQGPRIRILDAQTLTERLVIEDVTDAHRVLFDRTGSQLASCATNQSYVTVYDPRTGGRLRRYRSRSYVHGMDFLPDGRLLWHDPVCVDGIELKAKGSSVAPLDDGWLALGQTGQITFAPLEGRDKRPPLACGTQLVRLLASRGDHLAAVEGNTLRVFRLSDAAVRFEVDLGAYPHALRFVDGERLAVAAAGWRLMTVDGEELVRFGPQGRGLGARGATVWHATDTDVEIHRLST